MKLPRWGGVERERKRERRNRGVEGKRERRKKVGGVTADMFLLFAL